jgi:hypothetical protein
MKRLAVHVAEMPPERRSDLTGRIFGLIELLGDFPQPEQRALVLVSFDARMRALAMLRDAPEFGAWTIRGVRGGDPDLLHEVTIETAATEPLIEGGDWPSFDATSFPSACA